MGIFQSLFTNSKAMININKIIDGLSSEKDIALANKFVESVQNATQYQRDEIFKLFTEIKGKTKE